MYLGAIIPKNFLNGNKFEEAPVERLAAQYLYRWRVVPLMAPATYEEYHINRQAIGDKGGFLKDGMEVALTIYGSEVLGLDLPATVELKIVEAEMAVAGIQQRGPARWSSVRPASRCKCRFS